MIVAPNGSKGAIASRDDVMLSMIIEQRQKFLVVGRVEFDLVDFRPRQASQADLLEVLDGEIGNANVLDARVEGFGFDHLPPFTWDVIRAHFPALPKTGFRVN